VNALIKLLTRVGLAGRHTYVLTVRGRKTGRPHSTPVTLIEDGDRWLVAPYGEVGWVRNVRAAGQVELSRKGRSEMLYVEEVRPEEAARVLREYFTVTPDTPLKDFQTEAARHPVFRLTAERPEAPPDVRQSRSP
jgi:deazaflavin-dependent oxidoreductase (nitroreductase family)